MKQFTVDDILTLRPCGWDGVHNSKNYTHERLNELFAGRKTLTLADVVDMQEVLPVDVVWLACHIFTPRQRVVFALKCAEDAGISAWEAARAAWAARDAAGYARYAGYAAREAAGEARDAAWAARDAAWDAAERQLLFIAETLEEAE